MVHPGVQSLAAQGITPGETLADPASHSPDLFLTSCAESSR